MGWQGFPLYIVDLIYQKSIYLSFFETYLLALSKHLGVSVMKTRR